jgi:hypothetical protein
MPLAPPGSFGSSSAKGRSRARRICGGFCGAPRGDVSFRGGGLCGGGLCDGNLSRLDGSVPAGCQDFRAVSRAGLRHAELLSREPALAQGVSGGRLP